MRDQTVFTLKQTKKKKSLWVFLEEQSLPRPSPILRDTSPSRAPTSLTHPSFNVIVYYSSHMCEYSRCQGERGLIDRHLAPKKTAVSFVGFFFFNHGTYG